MQKHTTSKEACKYLGICQDTLYRLVKRGRLTGHKTSQGWRFKRAEVEAYRNYRRRIKYDGLVFTFPIVTQYRCVPKKYDVKTKHKGDVGWISLNPDYQKSLSKKELAREYFRPIRYHRVRLAGGYTVIVVSQRDFDRLPRAEKSKWLRFELKPERIRQEIEK
ncbi:hypothetical protein ES708_22875 [subsurface metagenome]